MNPANLRIGFGYDVHKLAPGEEFYLGGLLIPCDFGAVGHSDADVLLHVICDALLGAASLGDIGKHFPDTDDQFKGIDSKILLEKCCDLVDSAGYQFINLDSTVCLQKPKIAQYIAPMRKCISEVMGVASDIISVKATTTEKLGFVGTGKGVSAYATVLLYKRD